MSSLNSNELGGVWIGNPYLFFFFSFEIFMTKYGIKTEGEKNGENQNFCVNEKSSEVVESLSERTTLCLLANTSRSPDVSQVLRRTLSKGGVVQRGVI